MARVLHDRHMAQDGARVEQALLLVQDGLHVLLGAEEALHQQVGLAGAHQAHRAAGGIGVGGLVDESEALGGEAQLRADRAHHRLVAHQDGVHQPGLHRRTHRFERVAVIGPGHREALPGAVLHRAEEVVEGVDPHGGNLSKAAGAPAGPPGE